MAQGKQAALDALDDILGRRDLERWQKIDLIREIATAADRMADGLERSNTISVFREPH